MGKIVGNIEQVAVINTTQAIYTDKIDEPCKTHEAGTKYQYIKVAQLPVTHCSAYRIGSMIKRKLHLRKAVAHYKLNYVRMAISKTSGLKNKIISLYEALKNIGINIAENFYQLFKLCAKAVFCIQTGSISLLFSTFVIKKILTIIVYLISKIKKALIQYMQEKFVDKRIINITNSTLDLTTKLGSLFASIIALCKFKPPSLDGTFVDEILRLIQIAETARSVSNMPKSISISAKKVIDDAKAFHSTEKLKEVAKSTIDKTKQTLKEIFSSFLSIQGIITLLKNVFYNMHKCIYNVIEAHLDSKITI